MGSGKAGAAIPILTFSPLALLRPGDEEVLPNVAVDGQPRREPNECSDMAALLGRATERSPALRLITYLGEGPVGRVPLWTFDGGANLRRGFHPMSSKSSTPHTRARRRERVFLRD